MSLTSYRAAPPRDPKSPQIWAGHFCFASTFSGKDILTSTSEYISVMNTSSNDPESLTSRREFLKNTGRFAAASALAGVAIPNVHAAGSDLVQVALIGCGGRGTGAADNALNVKRGPV